MRSDYLLGCEHRLLSELLRDSKALAQALTLVDEEVFTSPNDTIFSALKRLHMAGKSTDPFLLTAELGDAFQEYVEKLSAFGCGRDVGELCRILRDATRLEDAKLLAGQITFSESMDQAEEHISRLAALLNHRQRMTHRDASSAANAFLDRLSEDRQPEYINWGIGMLDKELYAERGDFVVLGGYPSAGKTALACQMACAQAEKHRVGFFSLETKESKLTDRIMCNLSGVELSKIKTRRLDASDWQALTAAAEKLSRLQLHIYEASSGTPQSVFAEALAQRLDIVYIDYLQLLSSGLKGGSRYEEVTAISRDLHILSQTHGICVVALAQLSRPERKGEKKVQPTMQSFKESGQIEQDADAGLLIYQSDDNDYQGTRILKIAKNKEGKRSKAELVFDGARQRFKEQADPGETYRAIDRAVAQAKKESRHVTWQELPNDGKEELPF